MQFTSPQFFKPCLTDVFVRYVGPHANLYDHKIGRGGGKEMRSRSFYFLRAKCRLYSQHTEPAQKLLLSKTNEVASMCLVTS